MFVARSIAADHKDLIQDVAYDFHGKRMATVSCDQHLKVWDMIGGEWQCSGSIKAHTASIWRLSWAHPEFGQVIATCSFDRTVIIWEELPTEDPGNIESRWVRRSNLVDSRSSVTDVKFGPKHLGLMVATCSAEGIVRIYEATDVTNLSIWNLQFEIQCKVSLSSLSWNTSRLFPPTIAIGSDDTHQSTGRVQILEYSEQTRKWAFVETISTILEPVRDIAFCPNLGRSYHILAVASKDVHLFTLKPLRMDQSTGEGTGMGMTRYEIRCVGQFGDHQSQVWRLGWNITGTVLASSGDDGCVRLWKGNYMDSWKCIAQLKGDSPVSDQSSS